MESIGHQSYKRKKTHVAQIGVLSDASLWSENPVFLKTNVIINSSPMLVYQVSFYGNNYFQ